MIRTVIGPRRNPSATQQLLRDLDAAGVRGTLYVGYPVLGALGASLFIDALLIEESKGLVVFDDSTESVRTRHDEMYISLTNRLMQSHALRNGRALSFAWEIAGYSPAPVGLPDEEGVRIVSSATISAFLRGLPSIPQPTVRGITAVVQGVSTLRGGGKRPKVRSDHSRGATLKAIEAEIANLDEWQRQAAIESPDAPQRIRGLAGSGKTIVLALKAAYLHARNPDWTIGVTFHTRSLYQQFKGLIRKFTLEHSTEEPDWDKLRVLHSWGSARDPGVYSEVAQRVGVSPRDFNAAKQLYGYGGAFAGLCNELLEAKELANLEPMFDVMLIDEAQDFPASFIRLAYRATKEPKRFVWAYDELQNLGDYSMAPPEELFGARADGVPFVRLNNEPGEPQTDILLQVCYRNPPWTLATAHALGFGIYREEGLVQLFDDPALWGQIGYRVTEGTVQAGQSVRLARRRESYPSYFESLLDKDDVLSLKTFETPEEQAEWVAGEVHRNLHEDELDARDILIITADPMRVPKDALPLTNALEDRGIASHIAGVTSSRDELFATDSVAVSGIFRAKGNEAAIVYVVNAHYCAQGPELIKRRNTLFTAITRSRAWVRVSGVGEGMTILQNEIERTRQANYELAFRMPDSAELARIRKIHRDMTPEEKARVRKGAETLEGLLAQIESGEVPWEAIPRGLRERLRALSGED